MANVKVFGYKHTEKLTDRWTKWTGQKLYAPDLSMQGHKKKNVGNLIFFFPHNVFLLVTDKSLCVSHIRLVICRSLKYVKVYIFVA